MLRNLFRVLLVLWAGSLWSLAMWVAPTLFYAQSDRHLAGLLAARLFSIETYLGLAVAAMALLLPGRGRMGGVYAAAALLAVNEWVLNGSWSRRASTERRAACHSAPGTGCRRFCISWRVWAFC